MNKTFSKKTKKLWKRQTENTKRRRNAININEQQKSSHWGEQI